MKKTILTIAITSLTLVTSCGPSEREILIKECDKTMAEMTELTNIDDLSKKRVDAYNQQITILKKQLKAQEDLVSETISDYFSSQKTMCIYSTIFGTSKEDIDKAEADLKEIQKKIDYYNVLILKDKKEKNIKLH